MPGLGLMLGLILVGGSSRADPEPSTPRVEFRWDAPRDGGCPTEPRVRARIAALLGGELERPQSGRLTAIARVRRDEDRWDLRLWVVTDADTHHRSVHGASCAIVAEAGALIAAMAIDPDVLGRVTTDEASRRAAQEAKVVEEAPGVPESSQPPPLNSKGEEAQPVDMRADDAGTGATSSESAGPASLRASAKSRAHDELRGGLRVAAGVATAALPGVGAALELRGGLLWPRSRLDMVATYLPPRTALLDERRSGITAQLLAAGVSFGPRWTWPNIELGVVAGVEAGAVLGAGLELARSRRSAVLWLAAALEPTFIWRFASRVALTAAPALVVPLIRSRFTVDGVGTAWRPHPAAVRATVGLEVRLP